MKITEKAIYAGIVAGICATGFFVAKKLRGKVLESNGVNSKASEEIVDKVMEAVNLKFESNNENSTIIETIFYYSYIEKAVHAFIEVKNKDTGEITQSRIALSKEETSSVIKTEKDLANLLKFRYSKSTINRRREG